MTLPGDNEAYYSANRRARRKMELAERYGLDLQRHGDLLDSIVDLEEELRFAQQEINQNTDDYNNLAKKYENTMKWVLQNKELLSPDIGYVIRKYDKWVLVDNQHGISRYPYGLIDDEEKKKVRPGIGVILGKTIAMIKNPETGEDEPVPVPAVNGVLEDLHKPTQRVKLLKIEEGSIYGLEDRDLAIFEVSPNNIRSCEIPKSESERWKKLKNMDVDLFAETMDIQREAKEIQKVDVEKKVEKVTYSDIGGMDEVIKQIRKVVELPIRHPEIYEKLGIDPPKGVLFYGPPGTGKTMLAKAIANEAGLKYYSFSGAEVMNKFYGESEARLRKIFEEAVQNSPSIIFIDELDALAPKRDDTQEVERRVVAQLLALMDGLENRGRVVILGATNRPDDLDPAVRRPGRFDKEIEFTTPTEEGRQQILKIHTRKASLADDVNIDELASILHGYTGADIKMLVTQAGLNALERNEAAIMDGTGSLDNYKLRKEDFMKAYSTIVPTSMREIHLETSEIKWNDVGGLDDVKRELIEAIEWPLKHKELFKYAGMKPSRGFLLYGPPGTGKTMLVKALANESQANFIAIRGPELYSKWVGESEKAIRELFRKARQSKPCIILFDEIDSLTTKRGSLGGDSGVSDKVLSQLLSEIDGMANSEGVYIIGTTNEPGLIDEALLRPGRFDKKIEIALPDEKTRSEIFKVHVKGKRIDSGMVFDDYVRETEGYSGADIEYVCRRAGELAMRDFISTYGDNTAANYSEFKIRKVYFDRAIGELKRKAGSYTEREEDLPQVE